MQEQSAQEQLLDEAGSQQQQQQQGAAAGAAAAAVQQQLLQAQPSLADSAFDIMTAASGTPTQQAQAAQQQQQQLLPDGAVAPVAGFDARPLGSDEYSGSGDVSVYAGGSGEGGEPRGAGPVVGVRVGGAAGSDGEGGGGVDDEDDPDRDLSVACQQAEENKLSFQLKFTEPEGESCVRVEGVGAARVCLPCLCLCCVRALVCTALTHKLTATPTHTTVAPSTPTTAGHCKTVEFTFDMQEDTADCIAKEMMDDLSLSEDEAAKIAKKIKEEISRLVRDCGAGRCDAGCVGCVRGLAV
jgi:hypothetical protein